METRPSSHTRSSMARSMHTLICHPRTCSEDPWFDESGQTLICDASPPTTHRTRGAMGPRDKREDNTCGCGVAVALHEHRSPRGPSDPRLCVIVSAPAGAERRGPYRCNFGDAALAVPRTTTGLPAASPRSSTPGGEPAYSNRRQQTWHGFADVSCPIVASRIRSQTTSSCLRPGSSDPGWAQDKCAAKGGDNVPYNSHHSVNIPASFQHGRAPTAVTIVDVARPRALKTSTAAAYTPAPCR
jgi:hypothetical protein